MFYQAVFIISALSLHFHYFLCRIPFWNTSFLLTFHTVSIMIRKKETNDSFIYWDSCPDVPVLDKSHESFTGSVGLFLIPTSILGGNHR